MSRNKNVLYIIRTVFRNIIQILLFYIVLFLVRINNLLFRTIYSNISITTEKAHERWQEYDERKDNYKSQTRHKRL